MESITDHSKNLAFANGLDDVRAVQHIARIREVDKKINESAKNMEAAKKELDKNDAKPAANEAKEAGKKLDEAKQACGLA